MGYFSVQPPVDIFERMKLHTEDAATLSHWPFQGGATGVDDSVGSNDIVQTPSIFHYQRVNGLDTDSDLLCISTRSWNAPPNATTNAPDIKNLAAVTVAAWVRVNAIPGANQSVVGIRDPGGGAAFNFPYELGILTGSGNIRFFWQSGTKVYEGTNILGIPLTNGFRRWHHIIGTRNSAQDTARLYMNGVLVDEATGLSAWSGGGSQNNLRFFNDGFGSVTSGQLLSVVIKNTYADTATAAALYADAKELVE